MKFNFKIQKYQTDAVDAIVKCFEGQQFADKIQYLRDKGLQTDNDFDFMGTGYRNADLVLSERALLDNIHKVQDQNFIVRSAQVEKTAESPSFDIEMETGTGKTYVYTKTMYELNKAYGWSKFLIVVPSVAIREGIYKSLEDTQEHFMQHYGKKIRFFIYNSKRLNMIDQYSSSSDINAMIINTQAFNTSLNKEKMLRGAKAMRPPALSTQSVMSLPAAVPLM